jgi:hypothetical protein
LHSIPVNFSFLHKYWFPFYVIFYAFLFWMFLFSLPFSLYVSTQTTSRYTTTPWAGTLPVVCGREQCTPGRHRCGLKL